MGISSPFDAPFYTGPSLAADVPYFFQVALGDRSYLIEPSLYRRRTIENLRETQDQSSDFGEQSLNPLSMPRRVGIDWFYGAGQTYFDDKASDRNRFRVSKGADPWTFRRLGMLKDTTRVLATTTGTLLLSVNGYFYVVDGSTVKFSTNPDGGTFTTCTGITGTPTAITTDGANVYIASNGRVWSAAVGTAALTAFGTLANISQLAYCNGRLVASATQSLYEIRAGGLNTLIFTHPWATYRWVYITGAPHGIVYVGTNNDRSEMYCSAVGDATGAITAPRYCGGVPTGETINTVAFYEGFAVLGTSLGARMGTVAATTNAVSHGPLIAVPGGVTALDPEGEFVWFSWSNYDSVSTGLGRLAPGRFTDTLVPAYASDLMATGQGTVSAVATFGGRRFFLVKLGTGAGLWAEHATQLVPTATLSTGYIRFGAYDYKLFASLDVHHLPLSGSIGLSAVADDGFSVVVGTSNLASSVSPGSPFSMGGMSAEAVELTFTLTRGTTPSTGPTLTRWVLRGLPTPPPVDEITLPIILRTFVVNDVGEGQQVYEDIRSQFDYLHSLVSTRRIIRYQEGLTSENVYVDGLEVQPEKWSSDRVFFEGMVMVRLKTVV